jgi:hypothetical protein
MSKIPNNIKEIFDSLENEVIWLHGKWNIYHQLFGTNEDRIALLNRSASTFFRLVQDIVFNDVILSISRLTDPKGSSNKENRSFEKLIALLDTKDHARLIQILKEKQAILKEQCEPLRIRRNKKISHSDLNVVLSIQPEILPEISRNSIGGALKTIRDFMNEVNLYFGGNYTVYENVWLDNDGETVISILEQYWVQKDKEMQELKDYLESTKKNDAPTDKCSCQGENR